MATMVKCLSRKYLNTKQKVLDSRFHSVKEAIIFDGKLLSWYPWIWLIFTQKKSFVTIWLIVRVGDAVFNLAINLIGALSGDTECCPLIFSKQLT